jgi:hypothetical protein
VFANPTQEADFRIYSHLYDYTGSALCLAMFWHDTLGMAFFVYTVHMFLQNLYLYSPLTHLEK